MKQDWKAVRKGNQYCAPSCGRGCTWREYVAAVDASAHLVKRLRSNHGPWKARVWENLGWHYSVSNREHIDIYPHGGDECSAFLQVPGPWGGNLVVHGHNSEKAIVLLLKTAKAELKPLMPLFIKLSRGGQ